MNATATKTSNRTTVTLLLPVITLALAGCWTAPIASVHSKGEPRLIQGAIAVESVQDPATVQAIDGSVRTLVVKLSDGATATWKAGSHVANFDQIRVGDQVKATLAQQLTVCVLRNGQLPGAGGVAETLKADAEVLAVDPSYRLLTLRYPNGQTETFKVGLGAKLQQTEPGDDVVVTTVEAVALRVHRR
jgi:hypothetical protein